VPAMLIRFTGSVSPSSIESMTVTSPPLRISLHLALRASRLLSSLAAREPLIVNGIKDMDSVPPARYTLPSPVTMKRAAAEVASIEETQLFWTVTAWTGSGRPRRKAVTLAMLGASKDWPTQPATTPSTCFLSRPTLASAASAAWRRSSSELTRESVREMCPKGVRAPPQITIFFPSQAISFLLRFSK